MRLSGAPTRSRITNYPPATEKRKCASQAIASSDLSGVDLENIVEELCLYNRSCSVATYSSVRAD